MLKSPKELFDGKNATLLLNTAGEAVSLQQLTAVAVVLIAAAHIDGVVETKEIRTILEVIIAEYNIEKHDAQQLYRVAEHLLLDERNINRYVSEIKSCYTKEQRSRVYDLMQEVICSDQKLIKEEVLFRKEIRRLFGLEA